MMPCSAPVGFDRETGEFLELEENPYKKKAEPVYAVAALLPQGFTRLLCPAAVVEGDPLPILGYTAVGLEKGKLVVAAMATDEHRRWHPRYFNTKGAAAVSAPKTSGISREQSHRAALPLFFRIWLFYCPEYHVSPLGGRSAGFSSL